MTIRCGCGKSLLVGHDLIGRRIKCRACGRTLEVRERSRRQVIAQESWTPQKLFTPGLTKGMARLGRAITRPFRRAGRFLVKEGRAAVALPLFPRITLWLAYGYLLFALLAWILLWGFGDTWWPGTVLLFIGRWIMLLPLLVLIPAALVLWRRAMVPLTSAALIIIGPVMGFQTGWRRFLPLPAGTPVRVVTFNAEVGDVFAMRLFEHLEEWSADIIAFQECGPVLRGEIRRLTDWETYDEQGGCLITRFPITSVEVMDRSTFAFIQEFDRNNIGGSADVVRYTLATPSGPIDVTTVHLETPRKGLEGFLSKTDNFTGASPLHRLKLNTELRDIESRAARSWVERGRNPKLVVGDFNTPIESRIFQRHWGDLADAFAMAGLGFGMTKDNGWIRVRIDHILYGPKWRAKRVVVGPSVGSDHRPVIADLILEKQG
jgi:vancomycin resistance protein VanJ